MDDTALQIACCIERARIESKDGKSWPELNNEIYWHTREAAAIFSKKLGVPFPLVISALKKVPFTHTRQTIYRISKSYWPDLAHPSLVIKEVMEV